MGGAGGGNGRRRSRGQGLGLAIVAEKEVEKEEVGSGGDNVPVEPTRGGGRGALSRKKMQDQFSEDDGREQWYEHRKSRGVGVAAGKKIVMERGG